MAEPYISQIEAFPFGFAPKGWALCAGQLLPINQYQALFSLIGTYYGGNGTTNFALPDLRGRLALALGQGAGLSPYVLGQPGGEETHTLTVGETPATPIRSTPTTMARPAARMFRAMRSSWEAATPIRRGRRP